MQQTSSDAQTESFLDRVRTLILSDGYEPGDMIPESTLAESFGVSRTPVREAFKQLEREGLVEIRPRVGTFLRQPKRREIVELFQLKESLEGLAANLFAKRGAIPELAMLKDNSDASDAAALAEDAETYARLVHEFHWALVRGADNRKLTETYERLMHQLAYHRIVLKAVQRPGRLSESVGEHHAVIDAIENKDSIGAEIAMREHVSASSRAALLSLTEQDRQTAGAGTEEAQ
ncbi:MULTISPECIES: GntR family transcriptional regulator [Brevibacterium]|uniref:GntR family transcriptional regulator n=1 Tax=Brevibacterium casei TaxID=33889 RepID=A0A7T4A0Q9_9MICO|nr:GntR family transcriptional regulator [Brevibacterium casei]QQB15194.1 GntR family transcriptional regulator [Brevibacterium casei]